MGLWRSKVSDADDADATAAGPLKQLSFEKLHRDLIAEFNPLGVLEKNIIADLTHLSLAAC